MLPAAMPDPAIIEAERAADRAAVDVRRAEAVLRDAVAGGHPAMIAGTERLLATRRGFLARCHARVVLLKAHEGVV